MNNRRIYEILEKIYNDCDQCPARDGLFASYAVSVIDEHTSGSTFEDGYVRGMLTAILRAQFQTEEERFIRVVFMPYLEHRLSEFRGEGARC